MSRGEVCLGLDGRVGRVRRGLGVVVVVRLEIVDALFVVRLEVVLGLAVVDALLVGLVVGLLEVVLGLIVVDGLLVVAAGVDVGIPRFESFLSGWQPHDSIKQLHFLTEGGDLEKKQKLGP